MYSQEVLCAAKDAFAKKVRDQVTWIAEKAWVMNLERVIKDLNEVVEAGRYFGVTKTESFTAKEIVSLAAKYTPFRTLELAAEIRKDLVAVLVQKGIEAEFISAE